MNCPNCNVTLPISDRQEIKIDFCPQCRGVWLDRRSLAYMPFIPFFLATSAGAGGTATALWFEEILRYGEELLALIFLPLMAAGVYLLDHFMFKSQFPRPEDMMNTNEKKKLKDTL